MEAIFSTCNPTHSLPTNPEWPADTAANTLHLSPAAFVYYIFIILG